MGLLGNIFPYENVLVTDGLTANAQAAITIALKYANQVYVTVATEEEKEILKKLFPKVCSSIINFYWKTHFDCR